MASISQAEAEKKQARPILAYIAIIFALGAPVFQLMLRPVWELFPFPLDRFMSLTIFWLAAAFALFVSVRIEGLPLSTFGITKNTRSLRYRLIEIIAGLILGLLTAIIVILFSNTVRSMLGMEQPAMLKPENILPFWVTLPAWITAGFFEELLFRSYPIERLTMLTGKRWLAAGISLVCFVGFHAFAWDWVHILTVGLPASLLITGLYLWRRSLFFVVLIHAVIDIPILLLPFIAPYL